MEPRLAFQLRGYAVDVMRAALWMKDNRDAAQFLVVATSMRLALAKWNEQSTLLQELQQAMSSLELDLIKAGDRPVALPESEIIYFPPVPDPLTIRDFYAFEEHVRKARARRKLDMIPEWYDIPVFYFTNPTALLGHQWELVAPPYTQELDFELEIGCVIGQSGRNLGADAAKSRIAGYTIMNDWSARDVQRQEMKVGLGPAKGKDFGTSLGPYLVTADEFDNLAVGKGHNVEMIAKRNGQELSRGNWKDIHFSFSEMIMRASQGVDLKPGDILGSGTVGTGCILELGPEKAGGWLQVGDRVELEIQGMGTLVNRIVSGSN